MNREQHSCWTEPRVILVATNLSDHPAVLHEAAHQARRTGAKLLLTHVVAPEEREGEGHSETAPLLGTAYFRRVRDQLEQTALQMQWQGIYCEPVVTSGGAAESLAMAARCRGADRVVIGARSHTGTAGPLAGSVAEGLLGRVDVPVILVGTKSTPLPFSGHGQGRVLLPLSVPVRNDGPVRFASCLAQETDSRLTLLHVLDARGMSDAEREQAQIAARTALAALAAQEPLLAQRTEVIVQEGDAAEALLDEAVCPHRDSIVLDASCFPERFGSQSFLRRVIAEAPCPVIVLPQAFTAGSQERRATHLTVQ